MMPVLPDVVDLFRAFVLHSEVSAAAASEANPGEEWAVAASRVDLEAEVAMRSQQLQDHESQDRAA